MYLRLLVTTFCLLCLLIVAGCSGTTSRVSQDQHQASVHYKMAIAHLQAKNPTLALKELLVAVKYNPNDSAIHVALAQAYQEKKAYSQAEKHYLRAIELAPDEARYQHNLASLYLDTEKWDKAISYFDKAAANLLFENTHVALAGKAYALYKKQDYQGALRHYDEAIAIAPKYALAHFLKSQVYQAMRDIEMQEYELRQAIDVTPQFLQARYELGTLLLNENAKPEAKVEFETIVNFSPDSEWGVKARKILKTLE